MNSGKSRASLMWVVAAYLIYISYDLFDHRQDTDTTMSPAARYLFIGLFVLAAAAIAVYGFRIWKDSKKGTDDPPDQQDDSGMKE